MDVCTLCKAQIPVSSSERWTSPEGEVVDIDRTDACSAIIDTSVGEFEICESCYLRKLPEYFTREDLAEIHYQFGLEYSHRDQPARSVEALTKALQLGETADIVAALAYAEDSVGHRDAAVAYYRRALQIDPSHFMSRENLQKLL